MTERQEALDWLRGLMALAVVFVHLGVFGFVGGTSDPSTALGKLRIYAVAIFFVLSGLSMAIAYDRFTGGSGQFLVRRIFRIWPLLWVVILLVAIPAQLGGKPLDGWLLFLNLTTLFGFVAPSSYINMGAWSIGNEMVYYALTPALIAAFHRSRALGNLITLASVAIGLVFAFVLLDPAAPLADQWALYVNPLNNLFLYCCGMALFFNFRDLQVPRGWWLLVPATLFLLYPAAGDAASIAAGLGRVVLSALAIAVVWCFYKCPPRLPAVLSAGLRQLGEATYGVYLLHPIVIYWGVRAFKRGSLDTTLLPATVVLVTVAIALLSWKFFEKPLNKLGHGFSLRLPVSRRSVRSPR